MSQYEIGYLIVFLPLIFSFLCLLINIPKSGFFLFTGSNLLLLVSGFFLLYLLPSFNTNLISNLSQNIVSAALSYEIGYLSIIFIILLSFLSLISGIFYQRTFMNNLGEYGLRFFYALNLLNLFASIGILTSINIVNLYIFIEIYSFTFLAIIGSSKNQILNKAAFTYFCQSGIGSILILIGLFALYLNFGNFDFVTLGQQISIFEQPALILALAIIFISGILLKFFPFWLYFENFKSRNTLGDFLLFKELFIGANIGFYLILKFVFFVFGINILAIFSSNLAILIAASALILYSNLKILTNNNFQVIIIYFCTAYFGFFLIGITINQPDSLVASFLFLLHYNLIGALLLLISSYMRINFNNCNIKDLILLKNAPFLPHFLKLALFFIASFPLTFTFFANLKLSYAAFGDRYMILILILIVSSFLTFCNLAARVINRFYFSKTKINIPSNGLQDNIYYLSSFFLLIFPILFFTINPKATMDFFENLISHL